MGAGREREPWDKRVADRWARQAREAANDVTRYERVSLREQVRSRRFWGGLGALAVVVGAAAWLGATEFVAPMAIGACVALLSPRRRVRSDSTDAR